jgi:hypothetical protein
METASGAAGTGGQTKCHFPSGVKQALLSPKRTVDGRETGMSFVFLGPFLFPELLMWNGDFLTREMKEGKVESEMGLPESICFLDKRRVCLCLAAPRPQARRRR